MEAVFNINLVSALLLLFIGLPGNLAVLYFFLIKSWNGISSYYLFIIFMAITDLLVCILHPIILLPISFSPGTQNASLLCRELFLLPLGISTASVWILCGLSFDRYRKITKPLAKQLSKWLIMITCSLIIVLGHLIYLPYKGARIMDTKTATCQQTRHPSQDYIISVFIFHIIVCMTLICIIPISMVYYFNYKISKSLNNQANVASQQTELYKRNARALCTLRCLTIATTATVFLPICFLTVLYSIYIISEDVTSVAPELLTLTETLPLINSAMNAIVYLFHIKEFKEFYFNNLCLVKKKRVHGGGTPIQ